MICRECGCSEFNACHSPTLGNCWWVEDDLCSHCANKVKDAIRPNDRIIGLAVLKKELKTDYPLIPMSEIPDEARLMALSWSEAMEETNQSIQQKHKLASDITNYARRYHAAELKKGEASRKDAEAVIILFNEIFRRKISLTAYRQRAILARFKEGRKLKPPVTIDQFRAVFEHKKEQWTGGDMEKHLELETLVAQKHFFKYLDQARADKEFIHKFKKRYKSATPNPATA